MPQQEQGDRACLVRLETPGAVEEHLADVADYWRQTLALARTGVTYAQLLEERFPGLDPRRFGSVDLVALCERRLAAIKNLVGLP